MPADNPSARPPPVRHRKVFWSRIKWRWPFLVWVLLAWAGAWLYLNSGRVSHIGGTVEVVMEPVAPAVTGRLTTVEVTVGQKVSAGDVVAVFNSSQIDQEIAVAEAELERERLDVVRTFYANVIRLEEELRDLQLREVTDKGALAVIGQQVAELAGLVERNLITRDILVRARVEEGGLKEAVGAYPGQIAEVERSLKAARRTLVAALGGEVPAEAPGDAPEGLAGALDTAVRDALERYRNSNARAQIDLLESLKKTYTLTAGGDGTVASVDYQPGQVVPEGVPVANIVLRPPPRIRAFLFETTHVQLEERQEIFFATRDAPTDFRPATVQSVAPHVKTIPDINSPIPNRMVRGRDIIIVPDAPAPDLIPGQSIVLQLTKQTLWDAFLN